MSSEVKGKINAIKKRDAELNFRSNKVSEYISSFSIISQKDAKELDEKLTALDISRLKDIHVKKLIDIMPESDEDVKAALSGYHISVSADNIKKILSAVADYLPKK